MKLQGLFDFGSRGFSILLETARKEFRVYEVAVHERNGSARLFKAGPELRRLTI